MYAKHLILIDELSKTLNLRIVGKIETKKTLFRSSVPVSNLPMNGRFSLLVELPTVSTSLMIQNAMFALLYRKHQLDI